MKLPECFEERMKRLLGEEYPAFAAGYDRERVYGLRINTSKISPEDFEKIAPFPIKRIPWVNNGFFYTMPAEGRPPCLPSKHPYYFAGLYYLQEPSAMTPASRLPVNPGERVLDLCAAPGGKATELGVRLAGEGLLVANDISASRMKGLLKNIEVFGIENAFLTNETPERLSGCFAEYFDKILVDAPCSGEGMFRKEPAVMEAWTPDKPEICAGMQGRILPEAVRMLKPGGYLLYSTCTFAPVENEGSISKLLESFPEMHLEEILPYKDFAPGVPEWGNGDPELKKCVRIWPQKMPGEGHFLALLKKDGGGCTEKMRPSKTGMDKKQRRILQEFFKDVRRSFPEERLEVRGDCVYMVPDLPAVRGLKFVRNGLLLGELKKDRFEPSQPLAMTLKAEEYVSCLNLFSEDERIERYLKGETLLVEAGECKRQKGWQLVCVDGYPLGWGKLVNGILKNKYLSGWRKN